MPVEAGLARAAQRMDNRKEQPREDRFEQEALAFHQRVRDGYRLLAEEEPERFVMIDATRNISEIQDAIQRYLITWLRE